LIASAITTVLALSTTAQQSSTPHRYLLLFKYSDQAIKVNNLLGVMTGLDISKRRGGRHRTLRGGAMVAVLQTLTIIAGRAAVKERQHERPGHAKDISE
jgi:uncharacterized membrane protein